jgi:flagellar basal body rod protein FlgG
MNISPATNATVTNATTAAANGMRRNEQQLDDTAQNIASGSLDPRDMVSLSTEANSFKANAAVMKTSDEMNKSLLNVLT